MVDRVQCQAVLDDPFVVQEFAPYEASKNPNHSLKLKIVGGIDEVVFFDKTFGVALNVARTFFKNCLSQLIE